MTEQTTGHTVEKIGGTSMSRTTELLDTVLIGARSGAELYNRDRKSTRLNSSHAQ